MSQESFSNDDVAEFLNENFVSIKVDKEEFPDIDSYYQQACQLFSKSGGWPLSAFLLPDMKPFFVGTYYPLVSQNKNETTFPELIGELNRAYNEEREKVEENANKVTDTLNEGLISKEKGACHYKKQSCKYSNGFSRIFCDRKNRQKRRN